MHGRALVISTREPAVNFKPSNRVRFKYILLRQEGREGTVEKIHPDGGEFKPALLEVKMDDGFSWVAPLPDWELVSCPSLWRRLTEFVYGIFR